MCRQQKGQNRAKSHVRVTFKKKKKENWNFMDSVSSRQFREFRDRGKSLALRMLSSESCIVSFSCYKVYSIFFISASMFRSQVSHDPLLLIFPCGVYTRAGPVLRACCLIRVYDRFNSISTSFDFYLQLICLGPQRLYNNLKSYF